MATRNLSAEHDWEKVVLGFVQTATENEQTCSAFLRGLVAQRTDKVDCWKDADQKRRWLTTALLDIEPRLRKVCGCKPLVRLRTALQTNLKGGLEQVA